jgi:branched-chain amino acid transport system substrate-binding protein
MKRSTFVQSAAAAGVLAAVPRFTVAAGPAATVKIGFLDSFSGVFSDIGAIHKMGAMMALEDANRKGRIKYEFAFGDDGSKPPIGGTEFLRLVTQENVDVVVGGTSSGVGLANSARAEELGIFNVIVGGQDSAITGAKAGKTTYRFGPNVRMLNNALSRRALALGKKWYFIQSDYALGKDAYEQLSATLKRAGGTEVGHDVLPLGTSDFSSVLTKVKNSDADVLVLANSGLDATNTAKQWVQFGLNKRMHLTGISLEDFYYNSINLDDIQGATFPVLWAPSVSDSAGRLAARLRRGVPHGDYVGGRHYLGYMSVAATIDRIAATGTTDPAKLAHAFDDHQFDCYKADRAIWHGCTHQAAQSTYAGAVVSRKRLAQQQFMFDIVSDVPAVEADGNCDSPWAKVAAAALAAQSFNTRSGYTPKTF